MASEHSEIKDTLSSIGLSASVATIVLVIAMGGIMYKNYLEITKLRFQISMLEKDALHGGSGDSLLEAAKNE